MRKIFIGMLFFCLIIQVFAYINIQPTTFDKWIDDGKGSSSFYLTNTTRLPVAYRVYVEKTGDKNDMSDWVEVYPKSIKLDTGETREIKIQVIAPEGTPKGEYTANLVIKEIENPILKKEKAGAKIRIFTELKIEIAGYVGDLKPKFEITNLKVNGDSLEGTIKNIGDMRTKVELYLSDGKDEKYIGSVRLLVGDSKELSEFMVEGKKDKFKRLIVRDLEGKVLNSIKLKE